MTTVEARVADLLAAAPPLTAEQVAGLIRTITRARTGLHKTISKLPRTDVRRAAAA